MPRTRLRAGDLVNAVRGGPLIRLVRRLWSRGSVFFQSYAMGPAPIVKASSAFPRMLLSVGVWSLYAVALFTPAIKADEGGQACTAIRLGTLPGWETLLFGWVPPLCIP